jgi:hypothetical protein
MDLGDGRQAGASKAPETEIEVMPEMARAGAVACYESDPRCEDMIEIVAKVFRAMLATRQA